MADITTANRKFHKDQIFRRQDSYFLIEAVLEKQPHDILYCIPFDLENRKTVASGIAERVNSNILNHLVFMGEADFIDPTSALQETVSPTTKQQNQIDMWLDYIDKLLSVSDGRLSRANKDIEAAKKEVNWASYNYPIPSNSTCQKRVKEFDERKNDPRALCPKGYHAMEGASRLAPMVEDLLLKFIADQYLVVTTKENTNASSIYRDIKEEWRNLNKEQPELYPSMPCKQTFYNRLKGLDRFEVSSYRLNKNEKVKLRKQRKTNFIIDRILERVEIDAIHIGLGIIKEVGHGNRRTRVYRGRIVLMVALDVYSRSVIGYSYHISPTPGESKDLATQCFKSIILPKSHPNWPMHGLPMHLVSDATTAATGNDFGKIVTSTGVTPITTPRGEPWKKPFIERFFLTLRTDFLSKFDTYLGSKQYRNHDHLNNDDTVKTRALDINLKHCFTESEFIEQFEDYIVNTYHNNPHKGLLGKTPLQVWNESASECSLNWVTFDSGHPALNRFANLRRGRTVYKDGFVSLDSETYWSPKLKELWGARIEKIDIYYSDIDAKHISFEHKGRWYTAELCEHNYTPSDTLQRSALKDARKAHGVDASEAKERKNYKAKPSSAAKRTGKVTSSQKSGKTSQDKESKAIDTDHENAEERLIQAEEEILKTATFHAHPPSPVIEIDDTEESDDATSTDATRSRKLGKKL